MQLPVYLDNHATTRVDERVVAAMLPFFTEHYGNAASRQHGYGWMAEAAVERARESVARLLHASPEEIVFTSGATESINLALKGLAEQVADSRNHVVTAATEHHAVLDTCRRLREAGFTMTVLPVDGAGLVNPDDVARAITPRTCFVSIMTANNEIGTLGPIEAIGRLCREQGVVFHTDATQAGALLSLDVERSCVDMLALSGHKMYGPKGVGILYVRKGIRLTAQLDGGGQERGMRSGTLNVPGIVGMGAASALALEERNAECVRVATLRDALEALLLAGVDGAHVNGHHAERLPNNLNITLPGIQADRLMLQIREVAMSTGSACTTANPEPSHVLRAIGVPEPDLHATVRLGLGRWTTEEEVTYAAGRIIETVGAMRRQSATWREGVTTL